MKYKSNGFLVVSPSKTINGISYCGVDTDVWPADEWLFSDPNSPRHEYSVIDYEKVFLLDMGSAAKYYEYCLSKGIHARLLYCESTTEGTFYEKNSFFDSLDKVLLLGYDYAYPNGDYYSAILNDIIYRDLDFSRKWKPQLNKNGLFSSFEVVSSFSKDRERTSILANNGSPYPVYELGQFSVFRIYQIKGTL